MMSRSAADATRFTATSPHAYSKPPSTTFTPTSPSSRLPRSSAPPSHTPPNRSSIPAGGEETPREKVARLRQAARAAREAKVSQFDRVVARGRVWADRAHRVTALSLIAATGTISTPLPLLPSSHHGEQTTPSAKTNLLGLAHEQVSPAPSPSSRSAT